jgi:hypothetical protein
MAVLPHISDSKWSMALNDVIAILEDPTFWALRMCQWLDEGEASGSEATLLVAVATFVLLLLTEVCGRQHLAISEVLE